jgi:histone H3/H4
MENETFWKKCSSCKKNIDFGAKYYVCSVSTCNTKRTGYTFCSVTCFETHLPGARHKDAGAVEEIAPKTAEATRKPEKRFIRPNQLSKPSNKQLSQSDEILIIASRFKDFVNSQSEFNTSANVMGVLSNHVRHIAMQAIDNARADGRKTIMEQDVKFLNKLNLNI